MSVKSSRGLGRNLSALLGSNYQTTPTLSNSCLLAIDLLQPGKYQPRRTIEDNSLQELSLSIKQQGILQPLVVRELQPQSYEIIAGERRWRAAKLAGLTEVPVIIRQVDDETALALALIENIQREDLNPIDEARALARLTEEFSLTHQQLAALLAKSRTTVSNALRLLSLDPEVMFLVEQFKLDMGHARAILGLEANQQLPVANTVITKNLSVRETEKLVQRVKQGLDLLPSTLSQAHKNLDPEIEAQLGQLRLRLKTKIQLNQLSSGKGKLIIHYDSLESLGIVVQELVS